jgi:hypothetical protein
MLCGFGLVPIAAEGAYGSYTVQYGDTLSEIVKKQCHSCEGWQHILSLNPHIQNPNQIFAGQKIYLPLQGVSAKRLEKLSPSIQTSPLNQNQGKMTAHLLKPFLTENYLIEPATLSTHHKIAAFQDGHLLGRKGLKAFTNGCLTPGIEYAIVRPGQKFVDPTTKKVLGHQAHYLGKGHADSCSNNSTFIIDESLKEVRPGDHLVPKANQDWRKDLIPYRTNSVSVCASIIATLNPRIQITENQSVVINGGTQAGLKPGMIVFVYREARPSHKAAHKIIIPPQQIAIGFVYRTFKQMSYVFINQSTHTIRIGDRIKI